MRRLSSFTEIDWIKDGVAHRAPEMPCTVAHCVPSMFEAYAKILHPIYEDLSVEEDGPTWDEEDKANSAASPLHTDSVIANVLARSTLVYGGAKPGSRPVHLRWAQLARRLGLPFAATLSAASFTRRFSGGSWPQSLIGPAEGSLAGAERDALAAVLSRHTMTGRCLFHLWLLATADWSEDFLFEGALEDVRRFPDEVPEARCTPTHWFPDNRGWLVCSDYDLTFTLVGGPGALVHDLLEHPFLECVAVRPETRVDWKADLDGPLQ